MMPKITPKEINKKTGFMNLSDTSVINPTDIKLYRKCIIAQYLIFPVNSNKIQLKKPTKNATGKCPNVPWHKANKTDEKIPDNTDENDFRAIP